MLSLFFRKRCFLACRATKKVASAPAGRVRRHGYRVKRAPTRFWRCWDKQRARNTPNGSKLTNKTVRCGNTTESVTFLPPNGPILLIYTPYILDVFVFLLGWTNNVSLCIELLHSPHGAPSPNVWGVVSLISRFPFKTSPPHICKYVRNAHILLSNPFLIFFHRHRRSTTNSAAMHARPGKARGAKRRLLANRHGAQPGDSSGVGDPRGPEARQARQSGGSGSSSRRRIVCSRTTTTTAPPTTSNAVAPGGRETVTPAGAFRRSRGPSLFFRRSQL